MRTASYNESAWISGQTLSFWVEKDMLDVLYIEDIADNASLVQRVLSSQGYNVRWAQTAEEGLSMAEENPPQLILLDLGLPDIDGQTLVGYLRQVPSLASTPIVALTAWPEETARMMVTAYGCNGYVSKPFDVRQFISMVNSYFPTR